MSSKEKMFPLVERYYKSGLSIKAYCKKNKLSASTFQYWIHRYKKSEVIDEKPSFIAVETSPIAASLEIVFPNNVSIRVSAADLSLVKALINIY